METRRLVKKPENGKRFLDLEQRESISFILHFYMLLNPFLLSLCGSAVPLWLVCSTPEQVVWVRALARDVVLCYWKIHLTLTVPLST